MRTPKIFLSKRKDLRQVLKGIEIEEHPKTVKYLLRNCEEFLDEYNKFRKQVLMKCIEKAYKTGVELAEDIIYTKHDLEEFSQRIPLKRNDHVYLGVYLSALINKVITEKDVLTLNLNAELDGLGAYLERGTIIIKRGTLDYTGSFMEGGTIIVYGDVRDFTGLSMKKGRIIVRGQIKGHYTGLCMIGGEVIKTARKVSLDSIIKE